MALICHGAMNATIGYYGTAELAVSAAAHCRAPDAVSHRLVYRDAAGQLHARTLDYTAPHTATDENRTTNER